MNTQDLQQLINSAKEASSLLKAMSNQYRLMILCALQEDELSVSELNERIPLSQSALSQHLAALREANLVVTRRDAQAIYYQVNGKEPATILAVLKELFCPE